MKTIIWLLCVGKGFCQHVNRFLIWKSQTCLSTLCCFIELKTRLFGIGQFPQLHGNKIVQWKAQKNHIRAGQELLRRNWSFSHMLWLLIGTAPYSMNVPCVAEECNVSVLWCEDSLSIGRTSTEYFYIYIYIKKLNNTGWVVYSKKSKS